MRTALSLMMEVKPLLFNFKVEMSGVNIFLRFVVYCYWQISGNIPVLIINNFDTYHIF